MEEVLRLALGLAGQLRSLGLGGVGDLLGALLRPRGEVLGLVGRDVLLGLVDAGLAGGGVVAPGRGIELLVLHGSPSH